MELKKISNLKEFYENNESKDINLYLEYLENEKRDAKESLDVAVSLSLEKLVTDLRGRVAFIEALESIIKNSYGELFELSIAGMSDEELMSICNEELVALEAKKEKCIHELTKLKEQKKHAYERALEMARKNGYDSKYYEAEDTDYFFEDIKSTDEFVMELINSEKSVQDIKRVISYACSDDESSQRLAEMIVNLRKLAKTTDENGLKEAIKSLLSDRVLARLITVDSEILDEPYESKFEKVQYALKRNTKFVAGLPEDLWERVCSLKFDVNETYALLKAIYRVYKETGEIKAPVSDEEDKIEININECNERITNFDSQIASINESLNNRDKMIEIVKGKITKKDLEEGTISFATLANHVNDSDELDTIKNTIDKLEKEVNRDQDIADSIARLLSSPVCKMDFEIIAARNSLRIMNALGSDATEEAIAPIYEAEARREKQYDILAVAIRDLNEIKKDIVRVRSNKNIIRNLNGTNKQLEATLLQDYKDRCDECYEKLAEKGLLRIVVAHSYMDKESEVLTKPKNFHDIFNGKSAPKYQATEHNYQEFINRGVVSKLTTIEELNGLFAYCAMLSESLFTAKQNTDGTYEFKISEEETDIIGNLQEQIATMYRKLYDSRKKEREQLVRTSRLNLSKELTDLIPKIDMSEGEINLVDLTNYRDNLLNKIFTAESEIKALQAKIEPGVASNLDNATIGDEKAYYDMLKGFYEVILPSEEVKNRMLNI